MAWYAENDPHAAAVLAVRWPGPPNLGDITALDWAAVPPVDLITAGWPCQDISYAGPAPASRKEPAVDCGCTSLTAFASYDPRTSSWKTSPRSARAASRKVLGDLAALGYDTQWTSLRASDTGACHRRDRMFILATRPGAAARLAAADRPGRRVLQRRGTGGILAGPPGAAEEARP